MTFRYPFIFLFFFLFFFLFVTNVHAYEIFNSNHAFATNTNGYIVSEHGGNTSCFFWWCTNNTYSCMSPVYDSSIGSLNITNNGNCASDSLTSETIGITPIENDYPLVYGISEQLNDSWFVLPKNKEGIIVLKFKTEFKFNNGTVLPSEVAGDSYLIVQQQGTIGNYTYADTLNMTELSAGWNNITLIIPSESSDRNINIYMVLHFGTTPPGSNYFWADENMTLMLKQFQFYTMDITETRNDFTNDEIYELNKYCGNYSIIENSGSTGDHFNFNSNSGFVFGKDINGIDCGFVKLDNLIIARHFSYYLPSNDSCNNMYFYYTPNLFFYHIFEIYGSPEHYSLFYEQFLRTQIKVTFINNTDWPLLHASDMKFVKILYDDINTTTIDDKDIIINYSNAFRQTIPLLNNPLIQISNQNPAGNNFRIYYSACPKYSYYHSFFSSNTQIDNVGWYCSDITNSEGYILPNGTEINHLYCGDVGCNAEHTHCKFGFIGTYCEDSTHWVYSDMNGIQDTGSCLYGCYNKTYGIDCYSNDNVTPECINNNGQLVDCNQLKQNQTQTTINNCYSNNDYYCIGALSLSSVLGVTDKGLAESFLSLIISFIISITVLFVGRKSKFGMEGFLVSILIFLTGFMLIGKFNPIGWILCIILDGYLIYSIVLGGKK